MDDTEYVNNVAPMNGPRFFNFQSLTEGGVATWHGKYAIYFMPHEKIGDHMRLLPTHSRHWEAPSRMHVTVCDHARHFFKKYFSDKQAQD